jgi:hypothetical protein
VEVNIMSRTLRILFAATCLAVPFVAASAASAQTCAVPDPACVVDHVVDDGRDAAGAADEAASDAVNTAHGAGEDAVSTVRDTVDDALNDGGIEPPIDTGGGGGGNGRGDGNGHDGGADGGSRHDHRRNVGTSERGGGTVGAAAVASTRATLPASDAPPVPTVGVSTHRDVDPAPPPPTVREVATALTAGIAVMALLLGAVAVFLTLQDRLDRRDPKLAPAALGTDRVLFS